MREPELVSLNHLSLRTERVGWAAQCAAASREDRGGRFAVVGMPARLKPTGAFLRNARGFEHFG